MEKILKDVVDAWGVDSQMDMMIEEMSELTKALLKLRRNHKNPDKYINDICEEIADVDLMLSQMKYIFSDELIEKYKKEKLVRLQQRLDKHNKK